MSELFTCDQVAERYGVKTLTVWDWIRKKKLPAIKLGRDYRIRQEDIEAFDSAGLKNRPQGEGGEAEMLWPENVDYEKKREKITSIQKKQSVGFYDRINDFRHKLD